MKVVVLGAGLLGVCSAYFLKKDGFDVTVIERQKDVALETSFANGGQISVCYSEPWSNFANIKKMISWIGKEDSPLLIKPSFKWNQISWFSKFLMECFPKNNHENIKSMLEISLFSRKTLQEIRKEHNLQYEQQTKGILTFYTSEKSFQDGIKSAKFMSKFGCERFIKSKEETFEIEPTLKNSQINIFGSDYTPDDESGDAKIFTEKLKDICIQMGVEFLFGEEIIDVNYQSDKIYSVFVTDKKNVISSLKNNDKIKIISSIKNEIKGDIFVNCLGSYSTLFAKKLGINLPIYPAKGYSATIPIIKPELINTVSLTDMDMKIVLTRIGNFLRIAGTVEFNGYNLEMNFNRCLVLTNRTKILYPEGLDFNNVIYWTGLRPATPGMKPIIRQEKIKNLFTNSGHGTLGWTMAAGSGKMISSLISQLK
jgi:D-amino-acid dehydrogenase